MEKEREKIISEFEYPILRPLGIAQLICFIVLISSPFIWLWHTWDLAWKIGLTGLLGFIIVGAIWYFVKKIIYKVINEELDKHSPDKPITNKFKKRLDEAMKKRNPQTPHKLQNNSYL